MLISLAEKCLVFWNSRLTGGTVPVFVNRKTKVLWDVASYKRIFRKIVTLLFFVRIKQFKNSSLPGLIDPGNKDFLVIISRHRTASVV